MTSSFDSQVERITGELVGTTTTATTEASESKSLFSADTEKFDEIAVFDSFRLALKRTGITRLGSLADAAIRASERKLAPPELVFELFADAVDMSTVPEINSLILKELENRIPQLLQFTLSSSLQRPKLSLLRVANDILRRLSPSQDPHLCGRILMLLAKALPLSDSSGFNIGGFYNTEHETKIESAEQFGGSATDYQLYERFWRSTQFFASNVQLCLKHLPDFKSCMDAMLSAFESRPLVAATSNATTTIAAASAIKKSKDDGEEIFPKYLTAGRLLQLQLQDAKLRRDLLVQALFFLRQLIIVGETSTPPKPDLVATANTFRTRVIKLLNSIPPQGREFTDSILFQVDREVVWESWKKDKCPPIEQQANSEYVLGKAPESEKYENAQKFQKQKPITKPKWLENQQTDVLADEEDDMEEDEYSNRDDLDLELFSDRMADSFLPGYSVEDYDPKKDFVYCWQGMRLTQQRRFDLFQQAGLKGSFAKVVRMMKGLPEEKEEEVAITKDDEAMDVEAMVETTSITPVTTISSEKEQEGELTTTMSADGTPVPSQPPSAIGSDGDDGVIIIDEESNATSKRQRLDQDAGDQAETMQQEPQSTEVDVDKAAAPAASSSEGERPQLEE